MKKLLAIGLLSSLVSAAEINTEVFSSSLDFAQVNQVSAVQSANGSWCFSVEVRHDDQGWDHYADGWQVMDLDGNQLGYRKLAHPHDNEQPFIRSQCNIIIAQNITKVVVNARCNQHGFGGKPVVIDLRKNKGIDYSVKRSD